MPDSVPPDRVAPLDLEAIKRAIRSRHGIALETADPVLAVATLIEATTDQTVARYQQAFGIALDAHLEAFRRASESTVDQGAQHLVEFARDAFQPIVDGAVATFKTEIMTALQLAKETAEQQADIRRQLVTASRSAWIGACVALLAGGLTIGACLSRLLF